VETHGESDSSDEAMHWHLPIPAEDADANFMDVRATLSSSDTANHQ
jgi:hypothetical protein